jgi:sigma-B regulation protein RsbU (phosphoserine phosphatase)
MNFWRQRGLAFKLSLLILGGVGLVLVVILTMNYQATHRLMVEKIEENAFNLARATANRIDTVLKAAEKVPGDLGETLVVLEPGESQLKSLLRGGLRLHPELFGFCAAFASPPGKSAGPDSVGTLRSYYYVRDGERIRQSPIEYDYRYHDWYQIPEVLARPLWSEPYFGLSGGIVMTSYSVPFYLHRGGRRRFGGIVCVDLSLDWLRHLVASLKIGKTGYAFIITRNGTFVTHPKSELVMNETIFSIAEALHAPRVREIGRRMIAGETGFTAFTGLLDKQKYWMVYTPLRANGWSLGVLFPQAELMADITALNRTMLFLGGGGFLLILLIVLLVSGQITGPLRALAKSADTIARGELETRVPTLKTGDEVGQLARSFTQMQSSLREYIVNLTETTAAKERIESELNIASEIQMGILPKIYPPPFPDHPEFSLFATIKPAREVGGDLYDFFLIDERHLGFAVGDVSGKGVPAALFMAITRTLLRTRAALDPAVTIAQVNEDLSHDNPSMMFVTLFFGVLDLDSGELTYCNAGHNPPYLLTCVREREVRELETTEGIALGVMSGLEFSCRRKILPPGSSLFVYSDGVTEAADPAEELFGEPRLERVLAELCGAAPPEIAARVMSEIDKFAAGAPQADDITMLVVAYRGPEAGNGSRSVTTHTLS